MAGIDGWIPCGTRITVTCSVYTSEPEEGKVLEIKTTLGNPMEPDYQTTHDFNNGTFTMIIKKGLEYVLDLYDSVHSVILPDSCSLHLYTTSLHKLLKNCYSQLNKYLLLPVEICFCFRILPVHRQDYLICRYGKLETSRKILVGT